MELITHMCSATSAVFGRYSVSWKSPLVGITSTGPCTSFLPGFGSKVSRWLIPPFMLRKMTCSATFDGPPDGRDCPSAEPAIEAPSIGATVTPR